MAAPLAHPNQEKLDLDIGWRLPLAKHFEDSLLGILILYRRALRAFEPTDYVFHLLLVCSNGLTADNRSSILDRAQVFGQQALRWENWLGSPAESERDSGIILRLLDRSYRKPIE